MLATLRQISTVRLRIRSPLPTQSARGYSNSTRPRDKIALPWVWPSDVTSSNVVHEQLKIGNTGSFIDMFTPYVVRFNVGCLEFKFFEPSRRSECLDNIANSMTPVVISRMVDVINSKDEAALSTMMTPSLASIYTSALNQMRESGYDIKIDIKSLNNVKVSGTSIKSGQPKAFDTTVPFETRSRSFSYYGTGPHIVADKRGTLSKDMDDSSKLPNLISIYKEPIMLEFWSTAQARIAISLSQHGKVVDQDEGYMPIVVSMASPTYPLITEAPTILADGQIRYARPGHKIPFEWRVSDLFLNITNKEIRAIDRVRVL